MTEERDYTPLVKYFENGSDKLEFDLSLSPSRFRLEIQEIHWDDERPKKFFTDLISECFSILRDEEDQPVFTIDTKRLKRIVSFVEECNEQKFKFASDIEDYLFKLFMFKKYPGSQFLCHNGPMWKIHYWLLLDGTTVDHKNGHEFDLQDRIEWQESHKDDPPRSIPQTLLSPGLDSLFGEEK